MKSALADAGFELAGEYSSFDGAHVLVVTSDALKRAATQTELGGFAAGQRVLVTKVAGSS